MQNEEEEQTLLAAQQEWAAAQAKREIKGEAVSAVMARTQEIMVNDYPKSDTMSEEEYLALVETFTNLMGELVVTQIDAAAEIVEEDNQPEVDRERVVTGVNPLVGPGGGGTTGTRTPASLQADKFKALNSTGAKISMKS